MADLATQILIEIRDEARKTNVRLDRTVEQLDQTVERLDQTVERLDRLEQRQVAAEVRIATELVAVGGAIRELKDFLSDEQRLADRVGDHERRIAALEARHPA